MLTQSSDICFYNLQTDIFSTGSCKLFCLQTQGGKHVFFSKTKYFPRFFGRKCAVRTCRRTWRAWGCMQHECLCNRLRVHVVPTQSCVNSWSSSFCRAEPILYLPGFLVRARKLICFHVFLFVGLCVTNSKQITCNEGVWTSLSTRGSFLRGLHLSILCGEVCDDWNCTSQWHCAGSIAAKHACTRPRIHAISAFSDLWWTLLIIQLLRFSTLSGLVVRFKPCSQLCCAECIATKESCRRFHDTCHAH